MSQRASLRLGKVGSGHVLLILGITLSVRWRGGNLSVFRIVGGGLMALLLSGGFEERGIGRGMSIYRLLLLRIEYRAERIGLEWRSQ